MAGTTASASRRNWVGDHPRSSRRATITRFRLEPDYPALQQSGGTSYRHYPLDRHPPGGYLLPCQVNKYRRDLLGIRRVTTDAIYTDPAPSRIDVVRSCHTAILDPHHNHSHDTFCTSRQEPAPQCAS